MPGIFLYLLKLSISLVAVYAFYQLVLRRLTFYNWNRFYLLFYTLSAFVIAAINITPALEQGEGFTNRAIQFIPAVGNIANDTQPVSLNKDASFTISGWDILTIVVWAGVLIMLVRLMIRFFSFRKIVHKSKLISAVDVKLYQVDSSIIPFSFGNSIFLNQQQHTTIELQDIIRHEFVHIKQRHSIDILWSEFLCIFNWYNPVVWMIRKSIRQNLEFIADDKVLQSGINKTQYQYLLLKVTGNNRFSIATQFNFSSLKKRIAMMNKMKSAKAHLLKFLFLLPLLAILILSFRSSKNEKTEATDIFTTSGIVYDAESMQPISSVKVLDKKNEVLAVTDQQGFFTMKLASDKWSNKEMNLHFSKDGYKEILHGFNILDNNQYSSIVVVGIPSLTSTYNGISVADYSAMGKSGNLQNNYSYIKERFQYHIESEKRNRRLDQLSEGSEKPIWIIDGIPYAIAIGAKAWFDKEELAESNEFMVMVDGKIMTMDETNRKVKRSEVVSVASVSRAMAKKEYGLDYNILGLRTKRSNGTFDQGMKKNVQAIVNDTVPANKYSISMFENNGLTIITVKDKNQKEVEKLSLEKWNKSKAYYENLYGKLPEVVEALKPEKPVEPVEVVSSPVVSVNAKSETKVTTTVTTSPIKPEAAPKVSVKPEVTTNVKTTVTEVPSKLEEVVVVGKPSTKNKTLESVTVVGHPTSVSEVHTTAITTPSKLDEVVVVGKPASVNKELETVTVVGYPTYAAGKEILAVIKNDVSEVELKQLEKNLNDRGFQFSFTDIDYKDGKLAELKGMLSEKNSNQTFSAAGFSKIIIRNDSNRDEPAKFGFVVDKGTLKVETSE